MDSVRPVDHRRHGNLRRAVSTAPIRHRPAGARRLEQHLAGCANLARRSIASRAASAGIVAATSRRWVDDIIVTVGTVFVAFPALLLGLLVVAARGPSTTSSVLTIAIATGASVVVVTRSDAADIMRANYVTAARYCGASTWSIVKRHVARNLLSSLVVQATGAASIAVVAESTLSYLGLGAVPPTPSWGRMLASTQQYLLVHPLLTLWPALFISMTVLGISLLGDGLRERLDPSLRTQL